MIAVYDFDPARRTNAQAISDLAAIRLLSTDDRVLDTTVGPERGFWKLWEPHHLVTNDLDPNVTATHHFDARAIPYGDRSFDVVVFDPPYANRGTAKTREIDTRFGTNEYRSPAAVESLLVDGTVEALRVVVPGGIVLVKCQDATVANKLRPQSYPVWAAATEAGARLAALLYVVGHREQPTGKRQANVWSNCSTLMAFERHPRR